MGTMVGDHGRHGLDLLRDPEDLPHRIYSEKIANTHFWLVLVGQIVFSVTMWITGIQQGALWKAVSPEGTLTYSFMEGLVKNYPYWQMRTAGRPRVHGRDALLHLQRRDDDAPGSIAAARPRGRGHGRRHLPQADRLLDRPPRS